MENLVRPMLAPDDFGIIENASNQRTDAAMDTLEHVFRGMYLYCVRYSPELKPVERRFANIKRYIRDHEQEGVLDPVGLIQRAFWLYSVGGPRGDAGKLLYSRLLNTFILSYTIFDLQLMAILSYIERIIEFSGANLSVLYSNYVDRKGLLTIRIIVQ